MRANVLDRQGFLGPLFAEVRGQVRIGVVGVSGGGSHVVQQLAHVGIERPILFDPDVIGEENLHRHAGARVEDVEAKRPKVEIGERVYHDVRPAAVVTPIRSRWQERAEIVRGCDLIFGCVDTFLARRELEVLSRRYLIPYIDVGMDVFENGNGGPPRMVGQVVLSMPGGPCLQCLDVVTDADLAREASRYGGDAVRQQVVYANGLLASAAVGMALDVLTGWSGDRQPPIYLQYDGNLGTLLPSRKLDGREHDRCAHYLPSAIGDPVGRPVLHSRGENTE